MLAVVVTIGYNIPGATRALVESARKDCTHDLVFLVISHSQMSEKVRELERLAEDSDVVYKDYGMNRGLAKSWNEGILWARDHGADVTLIVNEDILMGHRDVDRLADMAVHRRDCHIVTGRAFDQSAKKWSSSEYGCFVLNPIALDTLGCFDENFFPIYCEDADYRRRAALAGIRQGYSDATRIIHGGSSSLRDPGVARQNSLTYGCNRHYYLRKWGGEDGTQRFNHPFDDPRFSNYIDPRVRDSPYPGFNRTDQSIVQF